MNLNPIILDIKLIKNVILLSDKTLQHVDGFGVVLLGYVCDVTILCVPTLSMRAYSTI